MKRPVKRSRKLIKPGTQLRVVGAFLAVAALGLLLQALLLTSRLTDLASTMPAGGDRVQEAIPGLLVWTLVVSYVVLLPLALAVGVLATFRLTGPVYRIEQHLAAVAQGEEPGPCRIRKGDEFQELCSAVNLAVEALRVRGDGGAGRSADEEPEQRRVA